jgi:hypothetical protein
MKMNYEAPITELIYFRSDDILLESDDTAGDGFNPDVVDMAEAPA